MFGCELLDYLPFSLSLRTKHRFCRRHGKRERDTLVIPTPEDPGKVLTSPAGTGGTRRDKAKNSTKGSECYRVPGPGKGRGIQEAGVRREMLGARSEKRAAWGRAREHGTSDRITGNLEYGAGRRRGKPGSPDRIGRNLGKTREPRRTQEAGAGSSGWEARNLGKRLGAGSRTPDPGSRQPESDAPDRSPLRSSRSHTVTMGRECLRWWMSHRDRVCTLCCELLNSDSFFSSAASEKADIPPKPRPRRPTPWSRVEESVAALVAASPPHPTLPHALTTTTTPESEAGRNLARWRPAGSDVMRRAPPLALLTLGKETTPGGGSEREERAEKAGTVRGRGKGAGWGEEGGARRAGLLGRGQVCERYWAFCF